MKLIKYLFRGIDPRAWLLKLLKKNAFFMYVKIFLREDIANRTADSLQRTADSLQQIAVAKFWCKNKAFWRFILALSQPFCYKFTI